MEGGEEDGAEEAAKVNDKSKIILMDDLLKPSMVINVTKEKFQLQDQEAVLYRKQVIPVLSALKAHNWMMKVISW